jgi:hypothetical protein
MAEMQEHIVQFFAYDHLPRELQLVSRPFAELAETIMTLPRNPERTVALRKLLEAKDAAVRAAIAKPAPPQAIKSVAEVQGLDPEAVGRGVRDAIDQAASPIPARGE